MSSYFTIPEWRHIALDKTQRNKLTKVDVQGFVKSWEEKKTLPGDRIWELRRAMKVPTFTQQKEDMRTTVLNIPQGCVCMHPPEKAVALLRTANVALDSLFANVKENEEKYNVYLQRIHQAKPSYVLLKDQIGYTTFNYCCAEDYKKYGRVSSPEDFRGFLRSKPELAAIDQFVSIYIERMAHYFCGSADATPDNIARIEQTINEHGNLTIIKYESKAGMTQHIDSVLRGDATVCTIGVGRDVVYDMSRAIGRNKGDEVSILRSSNPEGTMMVLDGEARYKWTHGVPHSHEQNGTKYTIHMCFFNAAGLTARIGKCEELDATMSSTPAYTRSEPETKIPQWRYIVLDKEQREKLGKVDVEKFVRSWEKKKTTTDDRIWELKQAMKVKTFIQQQDMRKEVLDIHIPQGFVCVYPPEKAVALLRAANVALDSLFANVKENEKKYDIYLRHTHQEKPSYVLMKEQIGYTIFNDCSAEDYKKYGRVSSPQDFRGFLRSTPDLAAIDQFVSIYIERMAHYFCGSADATPDNIARIEQTINEHGNLTIIKYESKAGMTQHIDSVLRGDATVCTIGVGRDVVYDMSRAIGRNKGDEVSILRSSNPEGTMIVLDGEARFKWTHGVPHEQNGTKYTLHMCFFHAGLTKLIGKCEELDSDMYSTPAYTRSEPQIKTRSTAQIGAHHHSLLSLLMQLQNTSIDTHIPDPWL